MALDRQFRKGLTRMLLLVFSLFFRVLVVDYCCTPAVICFIAIQSRLKSVESSGRFLVYQRIIHGGQREHHIFKRMIYDFYILLFK